MHDFPSKKICQSFENRNEYAQSARETPRESRTIHWRKMHVGLVDARLSFFCSWREKRRRNAEEKGMRITY